MDGHKDLAIVSYVAELPCSLNELNLHQALMEGKTFFEEVPHDRWKHDSYNLSTESKQTSKWISPIKDVNFYDKSYLGINNKEAEYVDPQQKILIQLTQHLFDKTNKPISFYQSENVMVSIGSMEIGHRSKVFENESWKSPYASLGVFDNFLSNKISHHFRLNGESKTINSACASSGTVLTDVTRALLSEQCDFAVAGAANLNLHPFKQVSFSQAGMLSPTGNCTPFDVRANGYVPGDGVVLFLICKLDKAISLGMDVQAVIKGGASNHNALGQNKSITVPDTDVQENLYYNALERARVKPEQINYIEAHGTGTSLGDPIEIESLARVYGKNHCHVGSIKGNIGHLEAASGFVGILKIILMMKNREIPPNSWIKKMNPLISGIKENLDFNLKAVKWNQERLIAAVSTFGFGGSNSHFIIENWNRDNHSNKSGSSKNIYSIPTLLSSASLEGLHGLEKKFSSKNEDQKKNISLRLMALNWSQKHRSLIDSNNRRYAIEKQPNYIKVSDIDLVLESQEYIKSPHSFVVSSNISSSKVKEALLKLPLSSAIISNNKEVFTMYPNILESKMQTIHQFLKDMKSDVLQDKRLLNEHQFTFKSFYKLWLNKIVKIAKDNDEISNQVLATCLAVVQLNEKWDLNNKKYPSAFNWIVKLINNGFINMDDVIMLLSNELDFDNLLNTIYKNYMYKKHRSINNGDCEVFTLNFNDDLKILKSDFLPIDNLKEVSEKVDLLSNVWLLGGDVDWGYFMEKELKVSAPPFCNDRLYSFLNN